MNLQKFFKIKNFETLLGVLVLVHLLILVLITIFLVRFLVGTSKESLVFRRTSDSTVEKFNLEKAQSLPVLKQAQ